MFRLRRYRVFVAFAIITIFAFYRFSQITNGRQRLASSVESLKSYTEHYKPKPQSPQQIPLPPGTKDETPVKDKTPIHDADPIEKAPPPATTEASSSSSQSLPAETTSEPKSLKTAAPAPAPFPPLDEGNPLSPHEDGQVGPYPTVHWTNPGEHFPVPTESMKPLPTTKPRKIPKIQHTFSKKETADEKEQRTRKLDIIKEALQHTWTGYREKAWMHDELKPVKGGFKDPFCGWAATLVDTLDTLWIMGLHKEFEEAVEATNHIDFTTSVRNDIPLFETTIRYLGGLLAAYDLSEHKYHSLLSKAVELAEVLMGAFDTPNRMPMGYYRWKPSFASQPHRADSRMVLAELGSLSMEFTRLAQLTKESKYYDAVARITDALEEWQMQTTIPGLWPESVDASGCEKSPLNIAPPIQAQIISAARNKTKNWSNMTLEELTEPNVLADSMLELPKNPKYKLPSPTAESPEPDETDAEFFDTEKSETKKSQRKGGWVPLTDEPEVKAWDVENKNKGTGKKKSSEEDRILTKRQIDEPKGKSKNSTNTPKSAITGQQVFGDSECKPQGLASPWKNMMESFGIGARADSTYEYLPKEYLLLGGAVDQYKSMYANAMDAVRHNLLYAPNVPGIDKRKILVAGSLRRSKDDKGKIDPEITHLTCFAGGMFAMGAKIFGREEELDIGKRLTDGCVWAYEQTKSGIMPEVAYLDICEDNNNCVWNETQWHESLDPYWRSREEQARIQESLFKDDDTELESGEAEAGAKGRKRPSYMDDPNGPGKPKPQARPSSNHPKKLKRHKDHVVEDESSLRDGKVKDHIVTGDPAAEEEPEGDSSTPPKKGLTPLSEQPPTLSLDAKKQQVEAILNGIPPMPADQRAGHQHNSPSRTKPFLSLTHAEYVQERIENENLPPGFSRVQSRAYILRPEAIESVWILYRITGDKYWREKGWEMFKSIQAVTRSAYGFSAIKDVMAGASEMSDSMESFWSAETLKYFYLLFSDEDLISLDDWVLNTEAHPFRRPDAGASTS